MTAGATGMVGGFSVAAVDATGAGDAFVAGLLDALLADPDALGDLARLRAICRFACAVGALTTTERGAIPALPTRATVERFLEGSS
jgi:fructokinase